MIKPIVFLVLIVTGFVIWIIAFIIFKIFSQSGIKNFKTLADKYQFSIDENHREGKIKLPVITGIYRQFELKVGAMIDPQLSKSKPYTFVSAVCENKDNLAFNIVVRTKANKLTFGKAESPIADKEFDDKFILNTNNIAEMVSIMDFNIKYKFQQAEHLGLFGNLVLSGNEIIYREPGYMNGEAGLMRIEIMLHLVCDFAESLRRIKPIIG